MAELQPRQTQAANEWDVAATHVGGGKYHIDVDITGEDRKGLQGILVTMEQHGSDKRKSEYTNDLGMVKPFEVEVPTGRFLEFTIKAHGTQLKPRTLRLRGRSRYESPPVPPDNLSETQKASLRGFKFLGPLAYIWMGMKAGRRELNAQRVRIKNGRQGDGFYY